MLVMAESTLYNSTLITTFFHHYLYAPMSFTRRFIRHGLVDQLDDLTYLNLSPPPFKFPCFIMRCIHFSLTFSSLPFSYEFWSCILLK